MSDVYTPEPLTPFEKQLHEEERALVEENKRLRAAMEEIDRELIVPNAGGTLGVIRKTIRAALAGGPQ